MANGSSGSSNASSSSALLGPAVVAKGLGVLENSTAKNWNRAAGQVGPMDDSVVSCDRKGGVMETNLLFPEANHERSIVNEANHKYLSRTTTCPLMIRHCLVTSTLVEGDALPPVNGSSASTLNASSV